MTLPHDDDDRRVGHRDLRITTLCAGPHDPEAKRISARVLRRWLRCRWRWFVLREGVRDGEEVTVLEIGWARKPGARSFEQ